MFCYQCEQTAQGKGCTQAGVCGKDAETAGLQDLLLYVAKGVAQYAHRGRKLGANPDPELDRFVIEALFATVTNVDFDAARIDQTILLGEELRQRARIAYQQACQQAGAAPDTLSGPAVFTLAADRPGRLAQAQSIGLEQRRRALGEEAAGLQELIVYGLKGSAAYMDHALILGRTDPSVTDFFMEALDFVSQEPVDIAALLAMALRVGEVNLKAMELLDAPRFTASITLSATPSTAWRAKPTV